MASIFFTERLPGISKIQSADTFDARGAVSLILVSGDRPEPSIKVVWGGRTERLPQKQGLCQVVNAADFGTLSDF
jgi:hypothetical protein